MAIAGPEKEAWVVLFEALDSKDQYPFDLDVSETEVILSSTNPAFGSFLRGALSDTNALRRQVNYTLQEVVYTREGNKEFRYLGENEAQRTSVVDYTNTNAENFLTRIFSRAFLDLCQLTSENLQQNDNIELQELRIPIRSIVGFYKMWESTIEFLTMSMVKAGIRGMQKAYFDHATRLDMNTEAESLVHLSETFQDIIGLRKIPGSKNQWEFYFNYGSLLLILFPQAPELTVETQRSSASKEVLYKFIFGKRKLINFFSSAFAEGFVLNARDDRAIPICLPAISHVVRKHFVNFLLLDISDSMSKVFKDYISHLKPLVKSMIEKSKAGDVIVLVSFATEAHSVEFILTDNATNDTEAIYSHLDTLTADGYTRLIPTLLESLQTLSTRYKDRLQSLMLISDGEGTVGNDQMQNLSEHIAGFKTRPVSEIPTLFTVGIGYFDKDLRMKLSNSSVGAHHTHLINLAEFHQVDAHITSMCRSRTLVRFVQECAERILPIYQGIPAIVPGVWLLPDRTFSYNDLRFTYSHPPDPSQRKTAAMAAEPSAAAPAALTPGFDAKRLQSPAQPVDPNLEVLAERLGKWTIGT